jgi:hypothetical protein
VKPVTTPTVSLTNSLQMQQMATLLAQHHQNLYQNTANNDTDEENQDSSN